MSNTPNEDLAASVSADGTTKDATEAYDKKAGKYMPTHTQGEGTMPKGGQSATVSPLQNVRGPK